MQSISSPELLFGILFVSFFACLCFLLSGGFLLMLIGSITRLSKKLPQRIDLKVLIRRGYYIVLSSFAFAFFFASRIVIAVHHNADFSSQQWLLFDGCIAVFMFISSAYVFSVYTALRPEEL